MKNKPLVSVIVPIYNAEKFISEAIESVLKQTYDNFELLLINDGSIDFTDNICKKYEKKDTRIKYYIKKNSGVSDTRNYGIEHANGVYITFLDADDTLKNNAIEILVSALSKEKCDAVFAGHCNVYKNKSVNRLMRLENNTYTYNELKNILLDDGSLTGILFGSVCGACYKTDFIKKNQLRFRSEVIVNEDGLFNIEYIYKCKNIKVINNIVYNYRQWKNSKKPLEKDKRFETSEPTIFNIIKQYNEHETYNIQFKRRKVSINFWNSLRVINSNAGYKKNINYLRTLFDDESLEKCYVYLDYDKMNLSKKILCKLMEKKQVILFYILVKYISPILSKVVKR